MRCFTPPGRLFFPVEALQLAKILRENADYKNKFSITEAEALLGKARELYRKVEEIVSV